MSNSQRPLLPHWQPTPGGVFARTDAYMERREKEGPAPVESDPTSFSAIEEELAKDLLNRCSTTVEPASKQDADLTEQKLEPTVVDQHTHHAGPTYHAGTTHGRIPLDRRAAILALRWYTDKTWDEISKCLGVSPDGAIGVVKRAKARAGEGADFEAVYRCLESTEEKERREHERLNARFAHKLWHKAG